LDVFEKLGEESTLGDAASVFLGRCAEKHPLNKCKFAVEELWEGRDMNARVASGLTPDFCTTLGAVVATAERSSLLDQSEIQGVLESSVSGKLRQGVSGDSDGVDEADSVTAKQCETDDVHNIGIDPETGCVFEPNVAPRTAAHISQIAAGNVRFGPNRVFRWRHFRNEEYLCTLNGSHTFLVIEPMNTNNRPSADLWIYMHGGGRGYWRENGSYDGSQNWHDEETQDELLDQTFGRIIDTWPAFGQNSEVTQNSLFLRLQEGYRIMAVSMCDHDLHQGQGTIEVNNPSTDPDPRRKRVDGQLAVLSAIDYTRANFPTGDFWIHGSSAGSMGAWPVTFILASEGTPAIGAILDSSVQSRALIQGSVDQDGGVDLDNFAAKVGFWSNRNTTILAEEAVAGGFTATALLDVYGDRDPLCGYNPDFVPPPALDAGFTNACEYVHNALKVAIDETAPNLHESLQTPAGHVVSFRAPITPSIEAWVTSVRGF